MANRPNRMTRLPRIGDVKLSLIPGDADHDGWLLLSSTVRMVGKVMYPKLFERYQYSYGGTAQSTTFGLPPLGDKFMLVAGTKYALGATGGAEKVTLTADQMPAHTHSESKATVTDTPPQLALLTSVLGIGLANITKPPTTTVSTAQTGSAGGAVAHDNMPPYLAVNMFIFAGLPVS